MATGWKAALNPQRGYAANCRFWAQRGVEQRKAMLCNQTMHKNVMSRRVWGQIAKGRMGQCRQSVQMAEPWDPDPMYRLSIQEEGMSSNSGCINGRL